MKIENHWLVADNIAENIVKDPSKNARHNIIPSYLVIHYTAGDTANAALNWFKSIPPLNPDRIAAHIVVAPDGAITQLIPFNRRANHSGYSTWDGHTSFNDFSIGIEIVNPGFVEKLPDGGFKKWINRKKNQFKIYPAETADKITEAKHKHKFWTDSDNDFWFKYTPEQLDSVYKLSKLLIEKYNLINAVGHDDISCARKPDPGPAFPWDEFKLTVLGRTEIVGKIFIVDSIDGKASFRTDHEVNSTLIKTLPNGFEVGVIETFGNWYKVYLVNSKTDVVNSTGQSIKKIGWIHKSLLVEK